MGLQRQHGDAHTSSDLQRLARLLSGIRGRRGDCAQRSLAQHVVSNFEQESAIYPSRIGYEDRFHFAQDVLQKLIASLSLSLQWGSLAHRFRSQTSGNGHDWDVSGFQVLNLYNRDV